MVTNRPWTLWLIITTAIAACIQAPLSGIATEHSLDDQLLQAAKNGSLEQVKILMAEGADLNAKDTDGMTALMHATKEGCIDILKLLHDRGAGVTTVQYLLKRDVNINQATKCGNAIDWAAASGNANIVKLLLDKGAKINSEGRPFLNPLKHAVVYGNNDVVQIPLEHGVDVNAGDNDGETALILSSA